MNKDFNKREQIIFGEKYNPRKYIDGCRSFKGMNVETLQELIYEDFVDVRMRSNNAPTIQRFLEYGEKHENVTYCGYATSPYLEDFRIAIVEINQDFEDESEAKTIVDFANEFHSANEFSLTPEHGHAMWAWWN